MIKAFLSVAVLVSVALVPWPSPAANVERFNVSGTAILYSLQNCGIQGQNIAYKTLSAQDDFLPDPVFSNPLEAYIDIGCPYTPPDSMRDDGVERVFDDPYAITANPGA